MLKKFLFYQPEHDYLRLLVHKKFGIKILLILNYFLWPFLGLISYLIIKNSANYFWQILVSCIITEFIEHILKNNFFWKRPLFVRRDKLPPGLVKKWYETGAFPSGHMTKASYFFFIVLATHVISPSVFLLIALPLMIFRVIVGFHYPIDMLGGFLTGSLAWFVTKNLIFPDILVSLIKNIFLWLKI